MAAPHDDDRRHAHACTLALALSMGAAVSLGITRFSCGLTLPPMRADLGRSYTLAGGMNTANAAGYLLGALMTPAMMRRFGPLRLLVRGAVCASLFMMASGFFTSAPAPLLQRLLAGLASAWVFVADGPLAARLGTLQPSRAGFLLGLYYGGTGFGITLSALLVPPVLQAAAGEAHGWAWWALALALASFAAMAVLGSAARGMPLEARAPTAPLPLHGTGAALARVRRFGWALAGYALFGAPVGGRFDHGAGAPQPADRAMGDRHQRLHDRVCTGTDRWADRDGLDRRRAGRLGARSGGLGDRAVGRGGAGFAAAAPGAMSAARRFFCYLSRPSAFMASCTAGRAATRACQACTFG